MAIKGTVQNGVVVFDQPGSMLDGTRVEVVVKERSAPASPLAAKLLKHAGKALGLPDDLAEQHDHYLHGTPKR